MSQKTQSGSGGEAGVWYGGEEGSSACESCFGPSWRERSLHHYDLKYNGSQDTPWMGAWNMINKRIVNGAKVDFWTLVNYSSRLRGDFNDIFCVDLINMCNSKGVVFHPDPLLPIQSAHPGQIEKVLRDIHRQSVEILKEIVHGDKHQKLLIIMLPDATGSYGPIKRISVIQCYLRASSAKFCYMKWMLYERIFATSDIYCGTKETPYTSFCC